MGDSHHLSLTAGNPLLAGATPQNGGVSFSIFSRHATRLILCLYTGPHEALPAAEFPLDPQIHRTGDIWHCHVSGSLASAGGTVPLPIGPGTLYLWRADGPFDPRRGHRFNVNRPLIDPYAKALTDGSWNLGSALAYDQASPDADLSLSTHRNDSRFPKCIVVDDDFDWEGDAPLNYPLKDCIIYETHVRGFTRSLLGKEAPEGLPRIDHPGTYRGVAEMAPYLKSLGITSLELLPTHEFDSAEHFRRNPQTGELLSNYWGYSPLAFFAPKHSYAIVEGEREPPDVPAFAVHEFKHMVRELHKAGIEVILDVVFNHTAEGNELGPTLSFRGLDNSIYYILDDNRRHYRNYSGCGNTLNCNHPVMRTLIQECLRYWVVHMHVDGFRFDLGSILGRDSRGRLLENPPVIESIAEDPLLRDTKIIAEAWDAGGAYQVGSFPGGRWAEWNDKYRDDIRRFWRGEKGAAMHLATRITGSSDLFLRDGRKPFHSINFITAHDGFTMNDLVSYLRKHNELNGEDNRDGMDHNWSCNHGFEGETEDRFILSRRNRQVKNFLATLLLSIGTPMLLGGDEFRRTQHGNNNAYCQDNDTSWYDWDRAVAHADILDFCAGLVAFRKAHPAFRRAEFYTGLDNDDNQVPDITWFDERGEAPEWTAINLTLAALIDGSRAETRAEDSDDDFYLMFNGSNHSVAFTLPRHPRGIPWSKILDTSALHHRELLASPRLLPRQESCSLAPKSLVLLMATQKA
jgi:glycogen operon protein